jgi:hypothetical protein
MKTFEECANMSDGEWNAYLKTLSMQEKFDMALQGIEALEKNVNALDESLERNFNYKAETDATVKAEYEALMDKVRK